LRDKDAIQIVCFKVVEDVKKLWEIGAATFAFYGLLSIVGNFASLVP
jgi:predicted amino acid dehydrogenase